MVFIAKLTPCVWGLCLRGCVTQPVGLAFVFFIYTIHVFCNGLGISFAYAHCALHNNIGFDWLVVGLAVCDLFFVFHMAFHCS